jgi:hypothetical protein
MSVIVTQEISTGFLYKYNNGSCAVIVYKLLSASMSNENEQDVLEVEPTPEDIRRETIKELTWHSPAAGSKHKTSLSGTRSGIGKVIYEAGQKATHVLFCGILFPFPDKAPYVKSGQSIYGGAEYCQPTDEFKCHECGEWFRALGMHIRMSHQPLTARKYRIKHGFSLSHGIITPTERKRRADSNYNILARGRVTMLGARSNDGKRTRADTMRERIITGMKASPEAANLRNKCIAQREKDLINFSHSLGRAPTQKELASFVNSEGHRSLHPGPLRRIFGVPMSILFKRLGIKKIRKVGQTTETKEQRIAHAKHARRVAIARWSKP